MTVTQGQAPPEGIAQRGGAALARARSLGGRARVRALEAALGIYREGASVDPEARCGEGQVLLALGRSRQALEAFEDALRLGAGRAAPKVRNGTHVTSVRLEPVERLDEARVGRAEALLEAGDVPAALQAVQEVLRGRPEAPDAWVVAASAVEAWGALAELSLFFEQACARSNRGFRAPHLELRLTALAASRLCYLGQPAVGVGPMAVLGALACRQPFAATPTDADAIVRFAGVFAANLVRAGHPELVGPLREPRAEDRAPGIRAAVDAALATLAAAGTPVAVDPTDDGRLTVVGLEARAAFVVRMLSSHPDLGPRVHREAPSERGSASEVPAGRRIVLDGPRDAVRALDLRVGVDQLLGDPRATLGRIFAFAGVRDDEGPLRFLVDHYPGAHFAREVSS